MIKVRDLILEHKSDGHILAENLSFDLGPGDKMVVIGEEGNGKSTLVKWLFDPAMVSDYVIAEGTRDLGGATLGYLPQELPAAIAELTAQDFVENARTHADLYAPVFDSIKGARRMVTAQPWDDDRPVKSQNEVLTLAGSMGLSPSVLLGDQRIGSLSGGEKVKLMMLALVVDDPDYWLMDEPSNDVDLATLAWLEKRIAQTKRGVLYISHDETLIRRTANRVLHLEQLRRKQKPVWHLANVPYDVYVAERAASFARDTQIAASQRREDKKREARLREIRDKVERQQDSVPRDPNTGRLLKKRMHVVKAQERRYAREREEAVERPEAEEAIYFRFADMEPIAPAKRILDTVIPELTAPDGGRILARNIELSIRGPEKICIVGGNGVGKTTLLRRLAKELLDRRDIRAAYMPQNYEEEMDLDGTPVDFLSPRGSREERTRFRTYMGAMRFTGDEMDHPIRELSGGQKAKLLLLKLSTCGANVLILDEPTRNFSPLSGPVIRGLLKEYPGVILSVSHDRRFIREVCDRVLELTPEGLSPYGMPEEDDGI